ncbi:hypothetical protein BH11MYX2_BH11MYX2_22660 [soil metagenome]
MRPLLLLVPLALVACKDKPAAQKEPRVVIDNGSTHPQIPVDAAPPPPGDWAVCKAALEKAVTEPTTKRANGILEGCQPCGDWTPILEWQKSPEDGGVDRRKIEQAMAGCNAWCTPQAKDQFMGGLDDAREKKTRTPWRALGAQCKEKVSAVPDARFLTAPFFALDRVARWAATQTGGEAALAGIDLPLPAITQTGVGVTLPVSPVTSPDTNTSQLTLTAAGVSLGTMPHAKMTKDGIVPQGEAYPGALVTLKELPKALEKAGGKASVFAHPNLPAPKLAELVAAANGAQLLLASASHAGPVGWEQHGVTPVMLSAVTPPDAVVIPLGASPDDAVKLIKATPPDKLTNGTLIQLHADSTVGGLAVVLGSLAYFEVHTATLVVSRK